MSSHNYVIFVDGACRSTRKLSSAARAPFSPDGELINLEGIFLGRTTKNIVEYIAVIDVLFEIYLEIIDLIVKLDSQIVVL